MQISNKEKQENKETNLINQEHVCAFLKIAHIQVLCVLNMPFYHLHKYILTKSSVCVLRQNTNTDTEVAQGVKQTICKCVNRR